MPTLPTINEFISNFEKNNPQYSYNNPADSSTVPALPSAVPERTPPAPRVNPDKITAPAATSLPSPSRTFRTVGGYYADERTGERVIGSSEELTDRTAEIANRARDTAQAMTDVINSKYNSKVGNDKDLIAAQDARARVLNTRTGVNDSATGASAIDTVQTKGNKILAADEAGRTAEISAALMKVDNLRANEQKAAEAQSRNDLVAYGNMRAKNRTEADTTLKALGTGGVDLSTLKEKEPSTYDTLLSATGLSPLELEAKYNAYKAGGTKFQYKISGDTVTAYGVDSQGNLKVMDEQVPGLSSGTFDIKELKDGTILKLNKSTGEYTELRSTSPHTAPSSTTEAKNQEKDALNWLARQPTYDPKDKQAFQDDEVFRAWAINQAKIEKSSQKKGGRTI